MGTPTKDRFTKYIAVNDVTGCWEWTGYTVAGYGRFSLGGRSELAHRVSFSIHNGDIPDGLCVCHTCDNTVCVNPEHLWLGSIKDNNQDRDRKGRHRPLKGSKNGCSKLKEKDIPLIRELIQLGVPQSKIAKTFGVTQKVIYLINRGQIWTHV